MKKLILSLIVTTTCSLNALAADPMNEYIQSAQEIRQIYRDLNLGGLQKQIQSSILEKRKEVVSEVSGTEDSQNIGGGLNLLFFRIGGSAGSKSSTYQDVTKILTTNAPSLQSQNQQAGAALVQLRSEILRLMELKSAELIRMKELGLINLSSAYELIKAGQNIPLDELRGTAQLLGSLQFAGQQTVSRCVKTKYANRRKESSESENASVSGGFLFLSFHASASSGHREYWRQIAHTETTCESTTNSVSVKQDETVYAVNFSVLDRSVADWFKALDLLIATQPEQVTFPSWDSPYYK